MNRGTIISDSSQFAMETGKISAAVTAALSDDRATARVNISELADALKSRAEALESRLAELEQDNARYTRRYDELRRKNARLAEENAQLKRADEDRKRLMVRCNMLEEEASGLRGSVSRMKKREAELERELERMKNTERIDYCSMYRNEAGRNASLEKENIALLSVIAAKEKDVESIIDTMLSWYDDRCERGAQARMMFKLMCVEKLADRLTKEQRARLADFDKRDKDIRATHINVNSGGMYVEKIDRQEVTPRRHDGTYGIPIYYDGGKS